MGWARDELVTPSMDMDDLDRLFALRDCRRKVLIGVAAVMLVLVLLGFGEHKLLLPSLQKKKNIYTTYLLDQLEIMTSFIFLILTKFLSTICCSVLVDREEVACVHVSTLPQHTENIRIQL